MRRRSYGTKLEAQEERLIDLATTSSLPVVRIRERIERTTLEKKAVKEKLEMTVAGLDVVAGRNEANVTVTWAHKRHTTRDRAAHGAENRNSPLESREFGEPDGQFI